VVYPIAVPLTMIPLDSNPRKQFVHTDWRRRSLPPIAKKLSLDVLSGFSQLPQHNPLTTAMIVLRI
jgi:hypothetical protein